MATQRRLRVEAQLLRNNFVPSKLPPQMISLYTTHLMKCFTSKNGVKEEKPICQRELFYLRGGNQLNQLIRQVNNPKANGNEHDAMLAPLTYIADAFSVLVTKEKENEIPNYAIQFTLFNQQFKINQYFCFFIFNLIQRFLIFN